ncbi:hypothetical protein BOTCAL_0240g00040 [Botryotinia calthae]|uniref:DUF7918 domain-containing protein n=1 Tax=Botryotinia calthae TaxID=38488 RepID=A0A4Y8CZM2_9HELO|nr:hypothetical protein BOTCAL_0240g00040 [Botryotinia calthae]
MAILTENNNEYEVKIIDCATNQPFKEYVKLGDRESHGLQYIHRVHQSGKYGEDIVGAPFVFSSLDVDEDLSNETDILGVDPADIGHFSVAVYRRTVENGTITISKKPSTSVWDAKKVDQLNFKKHGLGENKTPTVGLSTGDLVCTMSTVLNFQYKYRTFEFLNHLSIVPYPPPLYYNPWKSLAPTERQWALKELQGLSKAQAQLTPSERQSAFMKLQRDQKAFEIGEIKQQIFSVPTNKIIVLDGDGTTQQSTHPRALAEIEHEEQGPLTAIKNEIEIPHARNSGPNIAQKRKIKKEHVDLDHVDLSVEEPLAKRQKIKQEPTDINSFNNVKIKQEPIDLDTIDEKAIVLKKEATIKYDLTELEDAVILPEPSASSADREDSIYLEIAEEVLRQTAAEFVQTRE